MKPLLCSLILLVGSTLVAQNIPQELVGKWVVQRELPTRTISCWGDREAKAIIGTEIEYTADSFSWKHIVANHPTVAVAVINAEQFERENSSPSVNGSQISFRQLGINAPETKQVSIGHAPATISSATTEIPGDVVLLKNRNAIVFSVCNVYFEAKRLRP
jgi:endonuclease YncB( thermonuclease family)